MTTPDPSPASTATRLCQACGLCCNGVMFHTVQLQAKDSAPELAALGLRLKRKRGKDCILQPCPAFQDMQCTIYEQRPVRCHVFECQQLQRVIAGIITEKAALQKIHEVQQRVTHLHQLSLRTDGQPRKGPLAKRCATALAEPYDAIAHPEQIAQRDALASGLQELDTILDADFRIPLEK